MWTQYFHSEDTIGINFILFMCLDLCRWHSLILPAGFRLLGFWPTFPVVSQQIWCVLIVAVWRRLSLCIWFYMSSPLYIADLIGRISIPRYRGTQMQTLGWDTNHRDLPKLMLADLDLSCCLPYIPWLSTHSFFSGALTIEEQDYFPTQTNVLPSRQKSMDVPKVSHKLFSHFFSSIGFLIVLQVRLHLTSKKSSGT